ncbi:transposase [Burkholderia pseudomallei]|nr:transposase [Burkholderia pseudomallei]CAJ7296567.1 transposase [Burkholderia pseudomallei]
MKYAMMRAHEDAHPVRMMCRVLGVSPSGYYAWRERPRSSRELKQVQLDSLVREAYDAEKGRAGSPRVVRRLREQGHHAGRHQVAKSMRRQALRAKAARKYKATTNSNHNLPVAPNLLQQNFHTDRANQAWVSDITYIATEEGWLYLAVVLDLYSRHVIGWSMSERMTATLVCSALTMAIFARRRPKGVIVHSDRGSQYCSQDYQRLLSKHGLRCSMSKKGDCYDNAAMESWNHSLKVEAIHGERFATREQAKDHVFEYIEVYYNRQRLHSTLGYLSPVEFELQHVA